MLRSAGVRFFVVGALTLLMSIPMFFVADIINERAHYSRQTVKEIGREWGGAQSIRGPVLVLPVEETVVKRIRREVVDPVTGIQELNEQGNPVMRITEEVNTVMRNPIFLLPKDMNADIQTETQYRSRGIFSVPVYTADVAMSFDFAAVEAAELLSGEQKILWDQAELRVRVSSNRALRGAAVLENGTQSFELEPLSVENETGSGFEAQIGDPRGLGTFNLSLGLFGSSSIHLSPVGRQNTVSIASDWPHPSFTGAFLPNGSQIDDTGFEASWSIPHLARKLPQMARVDQTADINNTGLFGVSYYQPNDFYQKSFRAARYGLMFIALTFLLIFLMDRREDSPTHPVQYVFIGLAQLVFFVLMVALAEQIGFASAYLTAGGATIGLITMFAAIALRLGLKAGVLGGVLVLLYGVLYFILQSADYALLAGAILAFVALAATMLATRNEDWSGTGKMLAWFNEDPKPPKPS